MSDKAGFESLFITWHLLVLLLGLCLGSSVKQTQYCSSPGVVMRFKWEVTGCPAQPKVPSFLLSLVEEGIMCTASYSPQFTLLPSLPPTQPPATDHVPQTAGILPGAVREALSQSCHPPRVTIQSLLTCRYCHK